jgi:type II secretory pathway pseudopilin PulG
LRVGLIASQRGISLIEATIILAVLAILSAVLAPAIGGYVQDASRSTAKADVEVIGTALARMLTDVGESWVLRNGNGGTLTSTPSRDAANRVDLLVSTGRIPVVGVARSSGTPDWDAAAGNLGVQVLDYYLVSNTPSSLPANAYRSATNMSVLTNFDPDSGAQFNSEFAWRGSYLPGPIDADPWGNRYAANVEFLAKALGAGPSGNVNDVFVISAGPNGEMQTRFDTDGSTAAGDDLIYIVSGGTR